MLLRRGDPARKRRNLLSPLFEKTTAVSSHFTAVCGPGYCLKITEGSFLQKRRGRGRATVVPTGRNGCPRGSWSYLRGVGAGTSPAQHVRAGLFPLELPLWRLRSQGHFPRRATLGGLCATSPSRDAAPLHLSLAPSLAAQLLPLPLKSVLPPAGVPAPRKAGEVDLKKFNAKVPPDLAGSNTEE